MPDPGDRSKKAVSVDLEHMAVFSVPSGTGLVDITDVTWTESRESATYRWRFFPTNGAPDSGTGEVYAHLISLGPAGKLVNNSKSQPWIKMNDHMWAEWSHHDGTSVWVYYHPEQTGIQLLPDDQFDKYPLRGDSPTNASTATNQPALRVD
jgi:hypothetical protein